MNDIQGQYLITATQFYREGYADKIKRGEVKVYMVEVDLLTKPVREDASEAEKACHQRNLESGAYFDEMGYLEPGTSGDDYFVYHTAIHPSGGQGHGTCDATHQFLVIQNERWETVRADSKVVLP